ncbi:MAG: DUF488 domain-containing protein [Candidatus Saccharibacteria bacterium]
MNCIYTIGHSTRPIEEFVELLHSYEISQLVDIRTIPKSRHNPQFGQEEMQKSLEEVGIKYVYLKELGGLRPATKDSVNVGWHNLSFRNYADYMQTVEFTEGVEALIKISKSMTTAIMCAEAVPWRCHRSLVSDALLVRSIEVCEIIAKGNIREHSLTSFAEVDGTTITYPIPDLESDK